MTAYQAFLETKRRRQRPSGVIVEISEINPMLHEWQADITQWALRTGRAAIFADCGLGKTFMQLEWARLVADRCLIVAPLSVARQTVGEGLKLGIKVTYAREESDAPDHGVTITNYEMLEHFNMEHFDAVVLDESSILKNVDGKTRQRLTSQMEDVKYRLACTATPAPNDVSELCNHSEFLGMLPRNEMLAAYFVHDDVGWRMKGHAAEPMAEWMATWAVALRRPSDLGYSDDGYDLPPLNVISEVVEVDLDADGQLFPTELGGIGGRAKVRRETLDARVGRAVDLVCSTDDQWIVWCGLNDEASGVASLVDGAVNVEGAWSPDKKADALERFQEGSIRVLVTKPSIAGFGMNFQNCHRMAFVGLSDSWESYYQCIRRCWRFGQSSPVDAHIIVSELEQQISHNISRKEGDALATANRLARHSPIRKQTSK
jgi:hypothetical protein